VFGGQEALDRLSGRLSRERDDPKRADDCPGHVLGSLHGSQRHEARTVAEVRLNGTGGLESEPSLTYAARTRQCHEPARRGAQTLANRYEVALATDRAIGRRGQPAVAERAMRCPPRADAKASRHVQAGLRRLDRARGVLKFRGVGEDLRLESLERRRGLQAELRQEVRARPLVGGERVRLAAGPVQREHQRGGQPFTLRVRGNERLEVADERALVPELQLGVDSRFQCREPQLFQAADFCLGERPVRDFGQRWPAPQFQRVAQELDRTCRLSALQPPTALAQPRRENLRIDSIGRNREAIAARHRFKELRASARIVPIKRPAEPGDRHLKALDRARRGRLAPQRIGQHIRRQRPVRVQHEQGAQDPLLLTAELHGPSATLDGQRPQDPEFHA
jgi:hypothetical protein